ncbi:unnamed protein product [Diatraea saccharalis]|uniref:Uncharacterized protein n=1 Tax=Diatraea saccharalis TaxID=40085 RepID=A0A9N9RB67_9NEOP|nr:unnamed protein product [Diatraea saccharalis]
MLRLTIQCQSEFKKIESSKRSGSGASNVYKPTICWFEEMHSFLKDSNEYRPTTSTEVSHDDPGSPNNDDTQRPRSASQSLMSEDRPDSRSTTQSEMETRPRSQVGIGPMSPTEEESTTSHSSRNLTYQRFARRERNAVSTTTNDSVTAALQRLEQISTNINNPPHFDEFHYFGLNVASQLRALPLNLALDVQAEIQASLLLLDVDSCIQTLEAYPFLLCTPQINQL